MQFKTDTSPFFSSSDHVSAVMLQVLLALIPGTLVMTYFYGWGIFINIVLSIYFAVGLEALALGMRKTSCDAFSKRPQRHSDTFANQSYGFIDSLKMVLSSGYTPEWDAITMATPLDEVKTGLRAGTNYSDIIQQSASLNNITDNTWFWSSLAFLIGGIWLLYKQVIHWQIPASLIASLAGISTLLYLYSPENFASPVFHVLSGATMLGAFFIATDPVSASTTPMGKLIYGASIGFFIYIIRVWGNYPDAIAFSVLIMNMAVPMIDYYTQPRVLGHTSLISTSIKKKDKKP
ncbi:Ion-translocating oxidoreductase complex subunit D [Nymphon striatum]|nr:Ion-translocating oxidoreductase complex subunit D [Nymphon striatum]